MKSFSQMILPSTLKGIENELHSDTESVAEDLPAVVARHSATFSDKHLGQI